MSRRRSRQTRTRLPPRSRRTRKQHRAADQQIQMDDTNKTTVIQSVITLLQKLKAQLESATA